MTFKIGSLIALRKDCIETLTKLALFAQNKTAIQLREPGAKLVIEKIHKSRPGHPRETTYDWKVIGLNGEYQMLAADFEWMFEEVS